MYRLKKFKDSFSNPKISDARRGEGQPSYVFDLKDWSAISAKENITTLWLTEEDVTDCAMNETFYNVYKNVFTDDPITSERNRYDLINRAGKPDIGRVKALLIEVAHNMGMLVGSFDNEIFVWNGKDGGNKKGDFAYSKAVNQYSKFVNTLGIELEGGIENAIDYNSISDMSEPTKPVRNTEINNDIVGGNGTGYKTGTPSNESFDDSNDTMCDCGRKVLGDSKPLKFAFKDGITIEVLDNEGKSYKEIREEVLNAYKDFQNQK